MRLRFAAYARPGLAALLLSASAHAQTHVEARRDDDLVRDAALAMLSTYVLNLWTAEIGDIACNGSCTDRAYDLLYLPLVGPAIAAATPGVRRAGEAWSVILVADSVLQITPGLVALVAYLLPTRRVVVPNTASRFTVTPAAPGATLGLTVTWNML